MLKKIQKTAFTLAEVLITLTIIGIIAAMTVPNLMSNYQKQVYVVGLKKMHSVVQNATKMMYINNNCPIGDNECVAGSNQINTQMDGYTFTDSQELLLYLISKELKTVKQPCNNPSSSGVFCFDFPAKYTDIVGMDYSIDFADGTRIYRSSNGIVFDINGKKGPNVLGRDMFLFESYPESNGTWGYRKHENYKNLCTAASISQKSYDSYYCTQRVLMEDKMNY